MRVLIADDSKVLRQLVADAVVSIGCEVVGEAPDGVAAIVAAIELEPDVVVMDWRMPDLDGVAATAEIRARRPAISVIGYSSDPDEEIEQSFLRVGASAYVDKADRAGLVAELQRLSAAAC